MMTTAEVIEQQIKTLRAKDELAETNKKLSKIISLLESVVKLLKANQVQR